LQHFWRRGAKACDFTRAGRPAAGGDRVGSSTNRAEWIRQLVLAGPPAWAVITEGSPAWQQRLAWNVLDSLLGLFIAMPDDLSFCVLSQPVNCLLILIDAEWLDTLIKGAANPASRYAVFSFYLGFGDRTTRRLLPLLLNRRSWL